MYVKYNRINILGHYDRLSGTEGSHHLMATHGIHAKPSSDISDINIKTRMVHLLMKKRTRKPSIYCHRGDRIRMLPCDFWEENPSLSAVDKVCVQIKVQVIRLRESWNGRNGWWDQYPVEKDIAKVNETTQIVVAWARARARAPASSSWWTLG
jgi:hypothetical protein